MLKVLWIKRHERRDSLGWAIWKSTAIAIAIHPNVVLGTRNSAIEKCQMVYGNTLYLLLKHSLIGHFSFSMRPILVAYELISFTFEEMCIMYTVYLFIHRIFRGALFAPPNYTHLWTFDMKITRNAWGFRLGSTLSLRWKIYMDFSYHRNDVVTFGWTTTWTLDKSIARHCSIVQNWHEKRPTVSDTNLTSHCKSACVPVGIPQSTDTQRVSVFLPDSDKFRLIYSQKSRVVAYCIKKSSHVCWAFTCVMEFNPTNIQTIRIECIYCLLVQNNYT